MTDSMLDYLKTIDTSAVDELQQVRQQKTALTERMERLERKRADVSEAVFERVQGDYESQLEALAEKAEPLMAAARREYAKLRETYDRVAAAVRAGELDLEEITVRHEVGEYGDDEHEKRRAEVESALEQHRSQQAKVSEVRERFMAAFDSPEDLAAEDLPAAPVEAPPVPPPAGEDEPAPDPDRLRPPPPPGPVHSTSPPPAPGQASPGPADHPGAPTVYPDGGLNEDETVDTPESPPLRLPSGATVILTSIRPMKFDAATSSGTVRLPAAYLIPDEVLSEHVQFPVEPLSMIGRGPTNQIQITEDRLVSRHHAEIRLTEKGYVLKDVSQNGTFVNGEKIEEHLLAEGDHLLIGSVCFTFSFEGRKSDAGAGG